jgi:hypothetical protein
MSYPISPETKRRLGLGLTALPACRNRRRRRRFFSPRVTTFLVDMAIISTIWTIIFFTLRKL